MNSLILGEFLIESDQRFCWRSQLFKECLELNIMSIQILGISEVDKMD